jgi:hypothetical protein
MYYLPALASNLDPLDLSLPSTGMSHQQLPCLFIYFYIFDRVLLTFAQAGLELPLLLSSWDTNTCYHAQPKETLFFFFFCITGRR